MHNPLFCDGWSRVAFANTVTAAARLKNKSNARRPLRATEKRDNPENATHVFVPQRAQRDHPGQHLSYKNVVAEFVLRNTHICLHFHTRKL